MYHNWECNNHLIMVSTKTNMSSSLSSSGVNRKCTIPKPEVTSPGPTACWCACARLPTETEGVGHCIKRKEGPIQTERVPQAPQSGSNICCRTYGAGRPYNWEITSIKPTTDSQAGHQKRGAEQTDRHVRNNKCKNKNKTNINSKYA